MTKERQSASCTMECKFLVEENYSVLFVGLACLDVIKVLDRYPIEDSGNRCSDCIWQRGGNASNSATVFSLLGGKPIFFGTLADSSQVAFLEDDFKKYNISFDKCPKIENTTCPLSVVILNKSGGTRTILHTNKNLRELTLGDFKSRLDLKSDCCGWIHFEGRYDAFNIFQMIQYVKDHNDTHCSCRPTHQGKDLSLNKNKPIVISLEAEMIRFASGMDKYNLWQLPDVLFVGKDFAKGQGYLSMTDAAQGYFKKLKKGAYVICAWGENGAAAMSDEGLVTSTAFPPNEIVDTCGAGDTFNASVIKALSSGKDLLESIVFGCKIAGVKCGHFGFDDIIK